MNPVILSGCLFIGWLLLLRVTYINGLISDWNYNLSILIKYHKDNNQFTPEWLIYYEKRIIKPYKYYFNLKVWNIKQIIRDPFMIDAVQKIINQRYSKS